MTDEIKSRSMDTDVSNFIKKVKKKYGFNVHVVIGGLPTPKLANLVPLETLVDEAYSAMCIYDESLRSITSLRQKTRKRDVIQWMHCFYHIAWHYGYSKTAIGRIVERDHATVIHGVKSVTNFLDVKDPMTSNIYNLLMNHYKDNVGNFSENSKR